MIDYNGPDQPCSPSCNRLQPPFRLWEADCKDYNGYLIAGGRIVINNNLHSGCGTGVVNHATAFPAAETSLLLITMDPAGFAPGVVSDYNTFDDPDKGIVYTNNLIHVSGIPG